MEQTGVDMVSIQKGLSPALLNAATNLFLTALGEKFMPILGDMTKATALVESGIVLDSCLSAVEDGKLLGVLAIQTDEQSFLNLDFDNLRTHYGLAGSIGKITKLAFLQHHLKPKELYIEGIAVESFARGRGVGTKLLDALMVMAASEGFETVTLQVIDTNPRAQKLYERLGFVVEKRSKVWPVNRIIGWNFNESIYMKKITSSRVMQ